MTETKRAKTVRRQRLFLALVLFLVFGPLMSTPAHAATDSRIVSAEESLAKLRSDLPLLKNPASTLALIEIAEGRVAKAKAALEKVETAKADYEAARANEAEAKQAQLAAKAKLDTFDIDYQSSTNKLWNEKNQAWTDYQSAIAFGQGAAKVASTKAIYDEKVAAYAEATAPGAYNTNKQKVVDQYNTKYLAYQKTQQASLNAQAASEASPVLFENSMVELNQSSTAASAEYTRILTFETEQARIVAANQQRANGAISNVTEEQATALTNAANTTLETAEVGSVEYENALDALATAAEADDIVLDGNIANIPLVGDALQTAVNVINTFGNAGADLSPAKREESQKVIVSAVIASNIAQVAISTAASSATSAAISTTRLRTV